MPARRDGAALGGIWKSNNGECVTKTEGRSHHPTAHITWPAFPPWSAFRFCGPPPLSENLAGFLGTPLHSLRPHSGRVLYLIPYQPPLAVVDFVPRTCSPRGALLLIFSIFSEMTCIGEVDPSDQLALPNSSAHVIEAWHEVHAEGHLTLTTIGRCSLQVEACVRDGSAARNCS